MPRAVLTADEISAFRTRACEVATELFAERGIQAVSVRQVASALGVSPMTPYRYFENKEALFAAVRTRAFARFADRQQQAFDGAEPRTRLAALASAYIGFATEEPEAYKVMFELEQAPTESFPELETQQRRAFSVLVDAVAESYETGATDPETTAHLLWAQIHGLVSLHLAGKLIMGKSFEELCSSKVIAALGWRPQ